MTNNRPTHPPHDTRPIVVVGAYALMCLIWSSTWMVIKVGLREAPPLTALGTRLLIAGIIVATVTKIARIPLPRGRRFLRYAGFLALFHFGLPYALVYWGEQHISSGLTAVLYATMPFMVVIIARAALGDPIRPIKLLGITTAIVGVWIIFSDSVQLGGATALAGIISILCSVFFAAVSSVFVKKYGGDYHPLATLLAPFLMAATGMLLAGAIFERSNPFAYSAETWATILYLAILGSVFGFTLLFFVLKRVDVTVAAYQTFIIPVVAVFLGWIFIGEILPPKTAVGAAIIVAGVAAATLMSRDRRVRR